MNLPRRARIAESKGQRDSAPPTGERAYSAQLAQASILHQLKMHFEVLLSRAARVLFSSKWEGIRLQDTPTPSGAFIRCNRYPGAAFAPLRRWTKYLDQERRTKRYSPRTNRLRRTGVRRKCSPCLTREQETFRLSTRFRPWFLWQRGRATAVVFWPHRYAPPRSSAAALRRRELPVDGNSLAGGPRKTIFVPDLPSIIVAAAHLRCGVLRIFRHCGPTLPMHA